MLNTQCLEFAEELTGNMYAMCRQLLWVKGISVSPAQSSNYNRPSPWDEVFAFESKRWSGRYRQRILCAWSVLQYHIQFSEKSLFKYFLKQPSEYRKKKGEKKAKV